MKYVMLLGLPDAYDTQNKYLDTPDYLDLMDYGQYVTTMGERPMGLSEKPINATVSAG